MNGVITAGVQPAAPAQAAVVPSPTPWGFPELFVISQTALPALLYLPGTQAFRLPIRVLRVRHQPRGVRLVADAVAAPSACRTVRTGGWPPSWACWR